MKRVSWNTIVDAVGFAAFTLLSATGVLMRYVLPPGSGRHTLLWGFDRHEWGTFHYWTAIVFFAVIVLHLILHREWIVARLKGRATTASGRRLALGVLALLILLALLSAPFVTPVEHIPQSDEGRGRGKQR